MRLTSIEFNGYGRLLSTRCNVDGKIIALVGKNEAGKSTVLAGLEWLTSETDGLDISLVNRADTDAVSESVVVANFTLDMDEPADYVEGLDTESLPTRLRVARNRAGTISYDLEPRVLRSNGPRLALQQALAGNPNVDGAASTVADAVTRLRELVDMEDVELDEDDFESANTLRGWLLAAPQTEPDEDAAEAAGDDEESNTWAPAPEDAAIAATINAYLDQMRRPHPHPIASKKAWSQSPDFALFREADRAIESTYNLNDGNLLASPPKGLANLLNVGGTTARAIFNSIRQGDEARTEQLLRQVNETLDDRMSPFWSQADLRPVLRVDPGSYMLKVFVEEKRKGGLISRYTERSDGLRMFLAIVAFLATREGNVPPILLIDEAETHLHYDGQADLVRFLLHGIENRTIYSTHSPGCLPPDLGTSIRLVRQDPDRPGVSNLSNDFWNSGQTGFAPLLFAMGASAAAFSAFRAAVFAEGPSDMILLPSMFRAATGEEPQFQVVPGLSSMPPAELPGTGLAAVRVAYLIDGDAAGDKYREALNAVGIPNERILQLPKGKATEDLLTRDCYLAAINAHLRESGRDLTITGRDLPADMPVSSAVASFFSAAQAPPGKTAVASRLVNQPGGPQLDPDGGDALRELHGRIVDLLGLAE